MRDKNWPEILIGGGTKNRRDYKGSSANCCKIIEEVKSANGYISVGSDAHYCSQVGDFEHALKLLEAQKFPEEKIINSSLMLTSSFLEIKEVLHW